MAMKHLYRAVHDSPSLDHSGIKDQHWHIRRTPEQLGYDMEAYNRRKEYFKDPEKYIREHPRGEHWSKHEQNVRSAHKEATKSNMDWSPTKNAAVPKRVHEMDVRNTHKLLDQLNAEGVRELMDEEIAAIDSAMKKNTKISKYLQKKYSENTSTGGAA